MSDRLKPGSVLPRIPEAGFASTTIETWIESLVSLFKSGGKVCLMKRASVLATKIKQSM